MKKFLFVLVSLLCLLGTVYGKEEGAKYSLDFSVGQRVDNLNWNYPASGGTPNVLSELTWSDVESYFGKVSLYGKEGRYRLKAFYLKSLDSEDGNNQDSDYLYSGKTGEYSRSNNKTDGSYFEDYGISIGDNYKLTQNSDMTIWIGYEVNKQYLKITDGYQTIATTGLTPSLGAFANLNSSYHSSWEGFLVGLEYQYKYSKYTLSFNTAYHHMDYEAEANWNLRTDFSHPVSFEHTGSGATGYTVNLELGYDYSDNIRLYTNYEKLDYNLEGGNNTQYFSNGTLGGGSLNEANWENQKLSLGINIKF